jgi:hypothetical protein
MARVLTFFSTLPATTETALVIVLPMSMPIIMPKV